MPLKISAIISDYDGTLTPTTSITTSNNKIPEDLEGILIDISRRIPVCILSTKDLKFLSDKVQFAKIVSTLMGVETMEFGQADNINTTDKTYASIVNKTIYSRPIKRYNIKRVDQILSCAELLKNLANEVTKEFNDIQIQYKYTYMGTYLAAITLDYRHLGKWDQFKTQIEPYILKFVRKSMESILPNVLHLFTYSEHPFVDISAVKYNKGLAVRSIVKMLNFFDNKKILYLGDSENDNPAFKKADLSIGIRSDSKIKAQLDSDYIIEFNELRPFLQKLENEDFIFDRMSENIS